MPISAEHAIPLTLLVPVLGFLAIWASDKSPNLREAATFITGAVLLGLVLIIFTAVGKGHTPGFILLDVIDGINLEFKVEPLGALFALIASGLWIINSLYSVGYMRGTNEAHQTRFYMSFAIAIASAMGIAFAANLFTLFIFYEVLTLSTFPLVTHKGNDAARRGGRIYLGILMGTSIGLLLPAIAWVYAITGGGEFTPGGILSTHMDEIGPLLPVLLGLFAFGIGKAALMPIHPWLPNAMVAPTPVSAFLHAVAVVKAGVFSVLKIVIYIFGIDLLSATGAATPFMWLAAGSILLSSMIAMNKDNLKARLAYSTVSQLSYVTLGAMLATQMGVLGGAMQIAMHALGKMTLFMCAGAIYVASHKTLISQMRGLGRTMPITFGVFFIGAMSIIGLPPMGGSWPKFFLMAGAADTGQILIIAVLIISSMFNVIYLLSIPVQAFLMEKDDTSSKPKGAGKDIMIDWNNLKEAPFWCIFPPIVTAAGTVILFFSAGALYNYLLPIIRSGL